MKAKRTRFGKDGSDRRLSPGHTFRDIGPADDDADWRPNICENPEEFLAEAFQKAGRDYGQSVSAPESPTPAKAADLRIKACEVCGGALENRRPEARRCSPKCRLEYLRQCRAANRQKRFANAMDHLDTRLSAFPDA